MKYCALEHALKAQGRLGLAIVFVFWNQRGGGVDELHQVAAQATDVGTAGLKHPDSIVVVQ